MLPDVTLAALKEHSIFQDIARLEASAKWSDRGILFANNSGGSCEVIQSQIRSTNS